MTAKLTVLVGMPAAGKSTYAGNAFKPHEVVVFDDLGQYFEGCQGDLSAFMHSMMAEIVEGRLCGGGTVCVDFTNLNPLERLHWISLARTWKAHAEVVLFDTPFWLATFRNFHRTHPLPEITLRHCYEEQRQAVLDIGEEGWDDYTIIRDAPEAANPPHCRDCGTAMEFVWDARFKHKYVFYCSKCDWCTTLSHLSAPFHVIPGGKTA